MRKRQLKKYLDEHKVKYDIIPHSPAYTAQEIAANAHISGRDLAKTVIVKIDGELAMLVGPANRRFNLRKLQDETGADKVELASEFEFQDRFPDCETGAMPPLGNLYDMAVYVDDSLLEDQEIAFNAGNHSELVKMRYEDWAKLVKPKVIRLH